MADKFLAKFVFFFEEPTFKIHAPTQCFVDFPMFGHVFEKISKIRVWGDSGKFPLFAPIAVQSSLAILCDKPHSPKQPWLVVGAVGEARQT